ncbi:MAG TPA: hypothetical protein VLM91_16455 [Candidatus Methylomirabilis sp.]|nr:hypothetical protein [Candidatus Methylomirabilis sp.]
MLVEVGALTAYAWALLPNHAHLLVRTWARPMARAMQRLLTGYAGAFNRRYKRAGHLFQNRYKSVVVVEEPYLPLGVRPVYPPQSRSHRARPRPPNPRPVPLDRPQCSPGHHLSLPWQEIHTILHQFGPPRRRARAAYRAFVAEGLPQRTRRWSHVARAREGAAYLWCRLAGQSGRVLAAGLGLSHQAVYAAAMRGESAAFRWQREWTHLR